MSTHYDIVIMGSGVVGAAMALALGQCSSLHIALLEADSVYRRNRVSALSLVSQKILSRLNAWSTISPEEISEFLQMHVWEEPLHAIHFDCREVQQPALGFIAADEVLRKTLLEKIAVHPNIHFRVPIQITQLQQQANQVELTAQNGEKITTRLLIAADGAESWVRTAANIELKKHDYHQMAIVATVQTELPHQKTAWQRFLPKGPLAFLPLTDLHHCSMVWSQETNEANTLLQLNEARFIEALQLAFGNQLGEILHISPRHAFPLRKQHAKNYIKERIVLIGDAAHVIHPLAGQGLNLGLKDAAYLASLIKEAIQKGQDFAQTPILRRYERKRKSDNLMMQMGIDAIKALFANQNKVVRTGRHFGLNFLDKTTLFKTPLMRYAVGLE